MKQEGIAFTLNDFRTGRFKVQTVSGDSVEILRCDIANEYSIAGVVTYKDGTQSTDKWTMDGKRVFGDKFTRSTDLQLVREMFPAWVNVYDSTVGKAMYRTKEYARECAGEFLICTQQIFVPKEVYERL